MPFDATYTDGPEADDKLHNPDPARDHKNDKGGSILTGRGLMNLGCIFILATGIVALLYVLRLHPETYIRNLLMILEHSGGYPIISYFTKPKLANMGGFNFGGINASGLVPDIPGNWGLIDKDTPEEVKWKEDYVTGQKWQLVFSDEFNTEGRSFYPGDDPYWEAVDLHYWATGNKEWYDPEAITTRNGSLEITLSEKVNHDLNYTGGMMQTWNKFCFTGGLVETSVMLPGFNNIRGLWPAIWAMGNLGRAGYGATLDGMVCYVPHLLLTFPETAPHSGHTPTMHVISEPRQTRRSMDSLSPPCQITTISTMGPSHTNPDRDCHGVPARGSRILDLSTTTTSMSAAPPPRSICLKLRYVSRTRL